MGLFVYKKYDKFKNKTVTETHYSIDEIGTCKINFRHISSPKVDALVMDIYFEHFRSYFELQSGNVILRINNTRNYKLLPHESYRKKELITPIPGEYFEPYTLNIESDWYDISVELLKDIADASSIELQINGYSSSYTFTPNEDSLSLQTIAKAIYNAIFDGNAYKEELLQIEASQLDSQIAKERKKKQEEIKSDFKEGFINSMVGVLPLSALALVGGGFVSAVMESWEPLKKAGIFILVIVAIDLIINYLIMRVRLAKYER